MKAAFSSVDITPPIGLPIAGNIRADNLARGIHDNLLCNIIIFKKDHSMVCFLSFDLVALKYESCKYIKAQIHEKGGIGPDNIIISATHTHSGPSVSNFFIDTENEKRRNYIEGMVNRIVDEVLKMKEKLIDIMLGIGKIVVNDLSFNRRLFMKNGPMQMNWEDVNIDDVDRAAGPIDPELYVISISDMEGHVKAVMVNFTLHAAVLVGKDWLWSRDYIHYMDCYLKDSLGKDTVVFFANGAEGNVNHINYKDKEQERGFEEAERIGEKLGKYVMQALEHSQSLQDLSLRCLTKKIKLPLRSISDKEIDNAYRLIQERGDIIPSLLDGIPDEYYAKEIIKLSKVKDKDVETIVSVIELGDVLIATLPGEVFVEFGLEIKSKSKNPNTMVFGLTNDCAGYIPTLTAFEEGGYEIKTATTSKLDKNAGYILVNEILQLIY